MIEEIKELIETVKSKTVKCSSLENCCSELDICNKELNDLRESLTYNKNMYKRTQQDISDCVNKRRELQEQLKHYEEQIQKYKIGFSNILSEEISYILKALTNKKIIKKTYE